MAESIACLLNETGAAGSSLNVAKRYFQWCPMTNNAIYVINCSSNQITYSPEKFKSNMHFVEIGNGCSNQNIDEKTHEVYYGSILLSLQGKK